MTIWHNKELSPQSKAVFVASVDEINIKQAHRYILYPTDIGDSALYLSFSQGRDDIISEMYCLRGEQQIFLQPEFFYRAFNKSLQPQWRIVRIIVTVQELFFVFFNHNQETSSFYCYPTMDYNSGTKNGCIILRCPFHLHTELFFRVYPDPLTPHCPPYDFVIRFNHITVAPTKPNQNGWYERYTYDIESARDGQTINPKTRFEEELLIKSF